MKKVRIGLVFLMFVLVCAMLGACGGGTGSAGGESVTVIDMKGREITLPAKVERVVALSAADCEIIYALGAGDLLVGRGEYCNWPAEALDVPAVESGMQTNVEEIVALRPDVVFLSTMNQTLETVQKIEAAGIVTVACEAASIEDTYTAITLIGGSLGKSAEAAAVIGDMKAGFEEAAAAAQALPSSAGKTVYFEVSPLEYGLWAAGGGTFMDEIAAMLGLENIFADVDGWAEVSAEQVLSRDPDYIITTAMYYGESDTPVEEILGRDGWQSIAAVQNGRVLQVDADAITRPGPRLAQAAKELAALLGNDAGESGGEVAA